MSKYQKLFQLIKYEHHHQLKPQSVHYNFLLAHQSYCSKTGSLTSGDIEAVLL